MIATLKILRQTQPYAELERLVGRLAAGLDRAAAAAPHSIGRCGSMMTSVVHDGPVNDWESAAQCDTRRFARYFWGLLDRGIYMPCSQFEALFLSTAYTEQDIDLTIAAAQEAMARL
ncbi:MAG: hypothetical protein ABSG68_14900 [Thermoguttaceae bacterium]|jgi:glutamate-1-semialdehyde 2,1-aminomutase